MVEWLDLIDLGTVSFVSCFWIWLLLVCFIVLDYLMCVLAVDCVWDMLGYLGFGSGWLLFVGLPFDVSLVFC